MYMLILGLHSTYLRLTVTITKVAPMSGLKFWIIFHIKEELHLNG